MRERRPWAPLAVVLTGLLLVGILGGTWWRHVTRVPPVPVAGEVITHVKGAVSRLRVVEPLPLENYDRSFFGPAWQRLEPHPCNTRNEVLEIWLSDVTFGAGGGCSVESGWFIDPYTGHFVEFLRGPDTSAEVHVDHVVALADAWSKGAADWPPSRAQAFANDPLNLIPTQGWVNEEKGSDDASRWLPHHEGFWCHFAAQQILVKEKYDLGVTDAELAELLTALERC